MNISIDLRFLFLPLLNLIIFFLFLKSQDGNSWDVQDGTTVASVILAPSLFLVVYLCLIILSLCYATLASLFERCFNWLRRLTVASVNAHLLARSQVEQPIEQAQGVLEIMVM
ncbi:hypothetical protein WN944_026104 [Citrus x changshan-huyou]|uniref:Uncharacterized protein n=1 Tax=Citrus x changshan-huyou TaxID=2935761 RepID=A0AAP0LRG1_9ROSI